MQEIDVSHLQQTSTSGVPIEIRPFIGTISLMINRLAQSVEPEQRFISDAAHGASIAATHYARRKFAPTNDSRDQGICQALVESETYLGYHVCGHAILQQDDILQPERHAASGTITATAGGKLIAWLLFLKRRQRAERFVRHVQLLSHLRQYSRAPPFEKGDVAGLLWRI